MPKIAYLSAEIGFSVNIPTYSGGLGVLAGDHLKAAADAALPMVGLTLLYKEGYFRQHLDGFGQQSASYPAFNPRPQLEQLTHTVNVQIEGRTIHLHIWQTHIKGHGGHKLPVLFLDSDHEQNNEEDRRLTYRLYGGDNQHRIRQEIILGLGGVAAIKSIYPAVHCYHLNEGHCAFATLALLKSGLSVETIRSRCHITTHTPVPAGHDCFDYALATRELGDMLPDNIRQLAGEQHLSMSELGLSLSGSANGVSKLHGEVAREMFPQHTIGSVTNGVHHLSWVSDPMAVLFDSYVEGWRAEPALLRTGAANIPDHALITAKATRKRELLDYVNGQTGMGFVPELLTVGFARRAATYKRANLLFQDIDRLVDICGGRVQFIFAGKAHPNDLGGQELIQRVHEASKQLIGKIRVAYLANYSMWTGALITSGVDVWLNNPVRPREASGTSGMKATLNGVPNCSISDGWWAEGADDNRNGWILPSAEERDDHFDANGLYETLEHRVIKAFNGDAEHSWCDYMRHAIATGGDFTTARMVADYQTDYYSKMLKGQ